MLGTFWRGELSLPVTFWLFGVVGFALLGIASSFVVERLLASASTQVLRAAAVAVTITGLSYLIAVLVGVWRSASRYTGPRAWPVLARIAVILVLVLNAVMVTQISYLFTVEGINTPGKTSDNIAGSLMPQATHPYVGFWKVTCSDKYGLAIAPSSDRLYSVSFCGPSGCFKPGTYRSNTPLVGDSDYKIIDTNTIDVLTNEGFVRYYRCADATGKKSS